MHFCSHSLIKLFVAPIIHLTVAVHIWKDVLVEQNDKKVLKFEALVVRKALELLGTRQPSQPPYRLLSNA